MRHSLHVPLLTAVAGLALALPSSSPAAPAWLAPQDLSAPGQDASQPQVALDVAGNAVAVWHRSNGTNEIVQAATRPVGGSWSAPQDLSAPGDHAQFPQVALNAAGNAVAIWRMNANDIVQAATRPVGGSWSAPQALSAPGGNFPQVALDVAGNAAAVWQAYNGTREIVQVAMRPAGGSWSAPQDLSAPGQHAAYAQVALDAVGNATAVWLRYNGTNWVVQAATRPAGGSWSAPQDLSASGQDALDPQVALDAAGDAVAVWHRSNGTYFFVQAASRPAGGSWSAPQDLSAPGGSADSPQVALDAAGNAVAVWDRFNGTNTIVQAASRPTGGNWDAPQDLSAPGWSGSLSQVGLDAAGNATAVWQGWNGTHLIVQAATRPAGANWSAPQDLSAPAGQSRLDPQVAVDAAGNAVAVWYRPNGTNWIVQAAGYDAVGPVLAGLTTPTSGTAGAELSFSVSPFDVWSALAGAPSWTFGDGGSARGAGVTHRYAAAGTYTVTVSQSDTLGNVGSASRSLAITATCRVPRVLGLTLARARTIIRRANCAVGRVRRARSSRIRRFRVISQSPRAGRSVRAGTRVNLVVSRGRRSARS